MGFEIATTGDLAEMEARIIKAINDMGNSTNDSTSENVYTLTELRKTYKISEPALKKAMKSGKIKPTTHSDKPKSKRLFKKSEIKGLFEPL